MDDPGPYRDERASLVAEVDRLRSQLARERGRRRVAVPVALGLVTHVVLRQICASWLNAQDDVRFWVAAVVVVLPLLYSAIALLRAFAPERGGTT